MDIGQWPNAHLIAGRRGAVVRDMYPLAEGPRLRGVRKACAAVLYVQPFQAQFAVVSLVGVGSVIAMLLFDDPNGTYRMQRHPVVVTAVVSRDAEGVYGCAQGANPRIL